MFPQRPHEDPLLLDEEMREPLDAGLPCRRIASRPNACCCGSRSARRPSGCSSRIRASRSPNRGRACRPSTRSTSCARSPASIPHHGDAAGARPRPAAPRLAWPAPAHPADAIDDLEHDLVGAGRLLDDASRAAVRGHAHYLLQLNECLRRSVSARWARGRSHGRRSTASPACTGMTRPMLDVAAAGRAAVLAVGAAAIRGVSVSVPARRRSTG